MQLLGERMDRNFNPLIENRKQFDFYTRLVVLEQSFSMGFESARTARSVIHNPSLAVFNETTVREYVQACIAISLQCCRELRHDKRCWAYSTEFDTARNSGDGYLDVLITIHIRSVVPNIHVLVLHMRCSHTRRPIFHLLSGILESVSICEWKKNLIAVTTDGASNMTGRINGAFARLELYLFP